MLCCGRKKDPRHVIAQRLAASGSAFLPNHPLYPQQQQYVLANQSPYGTIGVQQQQLNLQQQQLSQLQQNVAIQQQNAAVQIQAAQQAAQQAAAATAAIPSVVVSNAQGQLTASTVQPTKSVHFLNANAPNAQPIYSNTLNSPANSGIYGQIRANPLANAPNVITNPLLNRPAGIPNDVFRQIEAVEKQFDQMNINLDAIEKNGQMLIRVLDPRTLGRAGSEAGAKYLQQSAAKGLQQSVQFIEIIKRPGQTLGLYIRNKDNLTNLDGVFISKIELDSPLYNSGLLHVGDEILAVNLVDVAGMSVDDVVVIMSIPRRLVLTIRTNNLSRLASNQINQQIRQAMNTGNYVQLAQLQQLQQGMQPAVSQPPIVVLKKELGREDDGLVYEDDGSNENLGNQLAQLVGDNVVVGNDEITVNGNMVVYEDAYGRLGLRPRDETNWTNRNQFIVGGRAPFAVTQQPGNLRDGRLSALGDPVYGTIDHAATALLNNRPGSRLGLIAANKLQTRASIHRPPTALSTASGSLRRPGSRLLHAESDTRLLPGGLNPTISDFFLEQITRPSSRLSSLGLNTDYSNLLNRRRLAGLNQSLSTQGLSTMLRRRSTIGGPVNSLFSRSAAIGHHPRSRSRLMMSDTTGSDSEFGALHLPARPASALGTPGYHGGFRPRSRLFDQSALPPSARYMLESGRASAMSFRSSSLPRHKPTPLDFRFSHNLVGPNKLRRPGSQVRFDQKNTYYSTADEDSDVGLEDLKAKHLLGRRNDPSAYSDAEYRQWLSRAPSTSAIYDTVRKRSTLPTPSAQAVAVASAALASSGAPLQASSISKIAHSAENLIDTIKNEQQKSLRDSGLGYFGKNAPDLPPRPGIATLVSDGQSTDRRSKKRDLPMTNKLAALNSNKLLSKSNISSHYPTSAGDSSTLGRTIPNPTPVKPSEDERMHLLTLNPREFFKYKYEKMVGSRENMDQLNDHDLNKTYNGLLYIHLLAGRGLRSQSSDALPTANYRDLYCVIECDRQHKARTVVRSGETSFDWDEKFELDLFEVKEIAFLLYSWDPQHKHKLCYKGMINLSNLSLEQNPGHSLALKMDGKGTLYLKLVYSELRICYARKHFPNKLFGGDLEMIVARENQGLSVPLIVKKCVEEVESRGMDLIGIYRICGSQVRKNLLKDAFENNSYLVELGVDHVPDINVITSLLKDYLRELPGPLFTKALFEMMVDGLSVCLPDDPSGNAKLMFSILECLPKVNRCTVLFLLDHLKAIVNNCERNKMSANAIATIFGPLFCTDNNSFNLRKTIEVFRFLIDIWPSKKEPLLLEQAKLNQLNDLSTSNLLDKSNKSSSLLSERRRRELASELSVEREKERLLRKDDNTDLMNKSLTERGLMEQPKSGNHPGSFNSMAPSMQQASQSSSNLNSLSGYNKPFSYHLPNRDFNFGSNISASNLNSGSLSGNLNSTLNSNLNSSLNESNLSSLTSKANAFNASALRNSTSAINSTNTSLGSSALGGLTSSNLGGSQLGSGGSHLGSNQLSSSQLGSSQFGTSQLGNSQLGSSQFGNNQLGTSQFGNNQLGSSQLGTSQFGTSQLGTSQLSGQNGSSNYYNTQMDSGLGTSSGSTGSTTGSGLTTGSSTTSTSRYSSNTTLTPKKTVGWASGGQQDSPTMSSSLIGNIGTSSDRLIGTSSDRLIGNTSDRLMGNTSSSLLSNNTSLIGNTGGSLLNSGSSKYSTNDYNRSENYLNEKFNGNDSYGSPSRYNYSSGIGSSMPDESREKSRSNVMIGTGSLIGSLGDTGSKYGSELNETNKKYELYR